MLARKAFCPITTACCSGVSCEIVTGVALIVFFSLFRYLLRLRLRSGRMGTRAGGVCAAIEDSCATRRNRWCHPEPRRCLPGRGISQRDSSARQKTSGLGMTIVRCRNADFPAPDVPARWVLPVGKSEEADYNTV